MVVSLCQQPGGQHSSFVNEDLICSANSSVTDLQCTQFAGAEGILLLRKRTLTIGKFGIPLL